MRSILAISLLALTGAAAFAQQASAPAKPADPDIVPTTLRLPDLDKGERVIITGMVPIPDVGDGAPLFTAQDLRNMEGDAQKAMSDTRRDFRRCFNSDLGGPVDAGAITFEPQSRPSMGGLLAQEFEAESRVAAATGKAQLVTERAEAARRDAARGDVDMKVVEVAELDRQAAVMILQKARAALVEAQAMIGDFQSMMLGEQGKFGIEWGDLDVRALKRKKEGVGLGIAIPEDLKTLAIRNVQASQVKDKKGKDVVVVRGEIANSGKRAAAIPSLSVSLVDERGWVMVNSTVEATGLFGKTSEAARAKPSRSRFGQRRNC